MTAIDNSVAEGGRFRSWGATHVGTVRTTNQDAYLNRPDLGVWAVADGAGGHDGGEIASGMVIAALSDVAPELSASDLLATVRDRLQDLSVQLREIGEARGPGRLCATTIVALLVRGDRFACLWAGDSRAYLCRDGVLTQLTRDHSLVAQLVAEGSITEAEAETHPHANIITRALGSDGDALELDKTTGQLQAGDRLLLCSDGLTKTLRNDAIGTMLAEDEDAAAERLVLAALTAGTTDNVTAVTLQVLPDGR